MIDDVTEMLNKLSAHKNDSDNLMNVAFSSNEFASLPLEKRKELLSLKAMLGKQKNGDVDFVDIQNKINEIAND